MREILHRLRALLHRDRLEDELAEELAFHRAMKATKHREEGKSPEESELLARQQLGNERRIRERSRRVWGWPWLATVGGDLAYAGRQLRRAPLLTLVAVASLGLGIAANTTVFSLIDAIWRRDLPVPRPAGLVRISPLAPNGEVDLVAWPEYDALRRQVRSLTGLAAHYSFAPLEVQVAGATGEETGAVVSASYFSVLGLTPERGRFFSAAEDSVPNRDAVAVVSNDFSRRLGGATAAVGQDLRINGVVFHVVGVMSPSFHGELSGGSPIAIWIPAMMIGTGYRWCNGLEADCATFELLGRLRPGASLATASGELTVLLSGRRREHPGSPAWRALVEPAVGFPLVARRHYEEQMRMLAAVAAALWILACANVGGLLLARAAAREQEIAVRRALGAGGPRLVRQMLTESLVLAGVATAVALAVTRWLRELLVSYYATSSEGYNTLFDLRLDREVLGGALILAVLTTLAFGAAPALLVARRDLTPSLRDGRAAGLSPGTRRWGALLVTLQLALSTVLLVLTGLLVQSSAHLAATSAQQAKRVAVLRLRPLLIQRSPARAQAFTREVMRRIAALPQVESATLARGQGLLWSGGSTAAVSLGAAPPRPEDAITAGLQEVGPHFFSTLRIPLVAGRAIDEGDRAGSLTVALVNATLAARLGLAPGGLGQQLAAGAKRWTIIGIAHDAQPHNLATPPRPFFYTAYWQDPDVVDSRLAVRARADEPTLLAELRRTVAAVDPEVPVTETMTLAAQIDAQNAQPRLAAAVTATTGALALVLTAVGLASATAYGVRRRTREFGLRMTLGATRGRVLRDVLGEAGRSLAIGLAIGLPAAAAAARWLRSWLYAVRLDDPLAFGVAAAALAAAAGLAAWLPASRAADLDPTDALRAE